uniref:Uncharacterized protein n=1 Tax=Setaria italica TaxID=4555 RepID=K4AL60_SETIT
MPPRAWLPRHAREVPAHLAVACSLRTNWCLWFGDGALQVLDARHSDTFLEKAYGDGTLQYEVLGEHLLQEKASAMFSTVFNLKQLASPSTASVLSIGAWTSMKSETGALDVKTVVTAHAAATNGRNLAHNEAPHSTFQAMRDTASDGKIVSVRILQLLL